MGNLETLSRFITHISRSFFTIAGIKRQFNGHHRALYRIALRQDQCSHRGKAQQAWPLFSVILKLISLLVLSQVTDVKKVSLLYIFFYFLGEQSKAVVGTRSKTPNVSYMYVYCDTNDIKSFDYR